MRCALSLVVLALAASTGLSQYLSEDMLRITMPADKAAAMDSVTRVHDSEYNTSTALNFCYYRWAGNQEHNLSFATPPRPWTAGGIWKHTCL